jgi:hypothetical protein
LRQRGLLDSRVKRGYDNESWAATRFFHTLESGNPGILAAEAIEIAQ